MALRLVQVDVAADLAAEAQEMLTETGAAEVWSTPGGSFGCIVSAVIAADRTGKAIDLLYEGISGKAGLRVLVFSLDAVVPRPKASVETEGRQAPVSAAAVSREEVYASIADNAKVTFVFVAMVVLATLVAAVGLTRDNTAAVIGAMVVAPLLGPNMALALGLTLGDTALVLRAMGSTAVGVLVCFAVSFALAAWLQVDPSMQEFSSRTSPGFGDFVLAIAAGAAGTLAYTSGAPTYLVGVMVAVALLPPTVASGLLLGHGYAALSAGAALLAAINTVALVLASMLTFVVGGMRPRSWWKEEPARRSARHATLILAALLLVLAGLILVSAEFAQTPIAP